MSEKSTTTQAYIELHDKALARGDWAAVRHYSEKLRQSMNVDRRRQEIQR